MKLSTLIFLNGNDYLLGANVQWYFHFIIFIV